MRVLAIFFTLIIIFSSCTNPIYTVQDEDIISLDNKGEAGFSVAPILVGGGIPVMQISAGYKPHKNYNAYLNYTGNLTFNKYTIGGAYTKKLIEGEHNLKLEGLLFFSFGKNFNFNNLNGGFIENQSFASSLSFNQFKIQSNIVYQYKALELSSVLRFGLYDVKTIVVKDDQFSYDLYKNILSNEVKLIPEISLRMRLKFRAADLFGGIPIAIRDLGSSGLFSPVSLYGGIQLNINR